ncbi:MAG TPA: Vms1/Ankzf1 family peptidyl-tRNA hydrolase [Jatrophihabitans sp.]|nr:Vms1/Ankzf1 family peptidyl-tRNA hydrolase [Jatrophihabitans sp.]
MDTTRNTETGAREIELRWAQVRADLQAEGADDQTLAALDVGIEADANAPGRHGLVAVAAGGTLRLTDALAEPPARSTGRWAALPHLLPYLAQRATRLPHIVVVANRTGADILVVDAQDEHLEHVDGTSTYPLHRTATADWSEKHFQARVENRWEQNAKDVAAAVSEHLAKSGAQLVLIAGDVRARHLIADALGNPAGVAVHTIAEGGRAAGSSSAALERAVRGEVLREVWRQRHEVLDHLRTNLGRAEYAVAGVPAVVQALRMAQADTVVISDDPASTLTAWAGPRATEFGVDNAEAADLGVASPAHDRFDAALVRAVVGTGAQLVVTPGAHDYLEDGIGALLRYETAS